MFANNPLYKVAISSNGVSLYIPVDLTAYHKSREVAMQAQERYSNGGISKEVLAAMCDKAIEMCNKQNNMDTLRTDMGTLWNNLKARMSDPVDELCAIRMGAIACFLENENPDTVQMEYTAIKMKMANGNPDIYAFFLNMGIGLTPAYSNLLRGLNLEDYLIQREQMLAGLTLPDSPRTA